MKNVALSAMLACATMACASSQTANAPATPASATATTATDSPSDATMAAPDTSQAVNATVNRQWLGAAGESQYVFTGSREQFVGVWVDVPQAQARPHVQSALTLTIDTSGSMAGDKIRHARHAAQHMVDNMKDGDIVAIHSFNGIATELVAPTVLDHRSRHRPGRRWLGGLDPWNRVGHHQGGGRRMVGDHADRRRTLGQADHRTHFRLTGRLWTTIELALRIARGKAGRSAPTKRIVAI